MQGESSSGSDELERLKELQIQMARRLVFRQKGDGSIDDLMPQSQEELDRSSETLIRKRISQTRGLFPISAKMLGKSFKSVFREYAASHHFNGHQALLLDAIHFGDWMLHRLGDSSDPIELEADVDRLLLRDRLRWEQQLCKLSLHPIWFRICRLRVDNSGSATLSSSEIRIYLFLRIFSILQVRRL